LQKPWKEKIKKNMERDREITKKLKAKGWKVLRMWEKDINNHPEKCIRKIIFLAKK